MSAYDDLRAAAESLAKSDDLETAEISGLVRQHAHPSWQDIPGMAASEENADARLRLLANPRPAVR